MVERYRQEMIAKAGVAVFLAGNKRVATHVVNADGVRKEFDIAVAQKKYPIPIGASGHVALQLWEEMDRNLATYFGDYTKAVTKPFKKLNATGVTNAELIEAVFKIVDTVSSKHRTV
jgi:hypothetical protein